MAEEQLPEEVTKHSFRQKTWDYLMKNNLVNFPVVVYDRIPNFKGASEAALRVAELEEFKRARVIKINPDKPQEPVRFLALEANKEILVPIPRLRSGLFHHVTPVAGATKNELRTLSKIHGLMEAGKPLGVESKIKVDLVILGSVCVSRDGYRLGKGKGFADLEYAIMTRMGAITQDTIVITTVHDCQVFDMLPPQLFKEYDVPVDIIVTPTQTIIVNPKLKKPSGIIWSMLSERRIKSMQVLQQLKEMDEKDGKIVVLKEEDSDTETQRLYRHRPNSSRNNKRSKPGKNVSGENDVSGEGEKFTMKGRSPKKRSHNIKSENDNSFTNGIEENIVNSDKNTQRRRNLRLKSKSQVAFSLKLSNISSSARIRDLKNALLERGVKPNEITWLGYRGICYLHFNKLREKNSLPEQPIQVDSIMTNLQQLCIGEPTGKVEDFIIVEPAKPISRIEVTDVSSV
ncbi:methenyltetrahydrofolate synthase domain-containing protein lost [Megachile rotundata]|uniref:methenyltetrahydrofolate synthase domain-containing protein lost n=1 Tax=Megachile rotundata TaxID=143995 RepID=UPI000258E65B|nr:PREDICTED: methenyltetrahydrofolate synthase domain-containing protein isoform X1 [Megachile rotundata]XP_012141664.1 PREDICTED: methenyltetrahydrofolate synthase domain-containing protein isoform X1 [Megachile rotundata]